MQWVMHGSFNGEVPCLIPGGSRWCQEEHPTSNAPGPHQDPVRIPVLILEPKKSSNINVSHMVSQGIETIYGREVFFITLRTR